MSHDLVRKKGGTSLLRYYSSLEQALRQIYPEFRWESAKFTGLQRSRKSQYKDLEILHALTERVGTKLGIKRVSVPFPFSISFSFLFSPF